MIEIIRTLRARWYLVVLVFVAAGGAAAALKLSSHSVPTGVATAQILVDSPQSALADLQQDTGPLVTRASVFAQLMTSDAVLRSVATAAGIPSDELTAEGPFSGPAQTLNTPAPSPARGSQIRATGAPYHLAFVAQANLPIITISAQAPNPAAAATLANSVYTGVTNWVAGLQKNNATQRGRRVTIRQLGTAQAGAINSGSRVILAGAAGAGILLLGLLSILGIEGIRRRMRTDPPVDDTEELAPPSNGVVLPGSSARRPAVATPPQDAETVAPIEPRKRDQPVAPDEPPQGGDPVAPAERHDEPVAAHPEPVAPFASSAPNEIDEHSPGSMVPGERAPRKSGVVASALTVLRRDGVAVGREAIRRPGTS